MAYRLAKAAEHQIDAILLDSTRAHGIEAAGRYGLLILTAMAALGDDPGLAGSSEVPRLSGVRAYPTRLSRAKVGPGQRVGRPRHLVIYRVGSDGVVEVLGLVHDRMVLSRAARKIVRGIDEL